jgi:hypothetical protein
MNLTTTQKAGIASGLARQSPKLIADKAKAIELHLVGHHTGQIQRALPHRHRNEIRRWLSPNAFTKQRDAGRPPRAKGASIRHG